MPKNYEAIGKLVTYINNGYSETDCLAIKNLELAIKDRTKSQEMMLFT